MKEERLYIVGYMASGKTTFGRALASRTGRTFLDLDAEIEKLYGKSIPEIIEEFGEAEFRRIESETLKQTASLHNAIISCGGGTPCYRDNMEFMTLHGMTLWLVASPERIAERIVAAGPTRPLVSGLKGEELIGFVKSHLLRRQPYYCKAQWRLNSENLENEEQIEGTVNNFLENIG